MVDEFEESFLPEGLDGALCGAAAFQGRQALQEQCRLLLADGRCAAVRRSRSSLGTFTLIGWFSPRSFPSTDKNSSRPARRCTIGTASFSFRLAARKWVCGLTDGPQINCCIVSTVRLVPDCTLVACVIRRPGCHQAADSLAATMLLRSTCGGNPARRWDRQQLTELLFYSKKGFKSAEVE